MPGRSKLLLAAILMIPLAISWTERASNAAEGCIAKPNAPPPRGSHWYYRVDRSTHQKCWYLGPEGAKLRASAPRAAALRSHKPITRPTEEKPGEAASAESAASDTKTVEDNSMATDSIHSSPLPTESNAWGPALTTTATAEVNPASFFTGDKPFDSIVASSPRPKELVTREPASMPTAYAEEETPSRADEPVVLPIAPAEPAASAGQHEPIVNFVNLVVAILAALGLVIVTVHTVFGPSTVRKFGRLIVGRRRGLTLNLSDSVTLHSKPAAVQAGVSRKPVVRKLPGSNDQDAHIDASVRRLLQELERRRPQERPQEFKWTPRKITA